MEKIVDKNEIIEKEIKIYYKIVDGEFKGFYHLVEKPSDEYFEINEAEFKELMSIGGEIIYLKSGNKLVSVLIEANTGMIKPILDKEKLAPIESATIEEQILYYKKDMLNISNKILVLEKSGFYDGDTEYHRLKDKLEISKQNYINACHESALQIDKEKK